MLKHLCHLLVALIVAVPLAGLARADLILNFTPSALDTFAGDTVEFDGTLTNTGIADVYLNGDVIILPYPDLSVDDTPFFTDSPPFLSGGDSYIGPFIDVTVDAGTPPGSYSSTYTVQGGVDSNTFDNLVTEDFTVNVGSIVGNVPEPGSLALLGTGLLMLITLVVARRKLFDVQCKKRIT